MVPKHLPARLLAAGLLLAGATAARADLFVCTSASGKTISADRPPPECADRPIRELRPDGSIRRVIEPPITAEQKAAREEERKRQIEEAERRRSQMRRDLALLETYASEGEIESTRNRALGDRQRIIERAQKKLEELRRDRKRLEEETEFYANRELPEKLKRALTYNSELVKSQERAIADQKNEMARVNERYDREVKRFRELLHAGAQPVQREPNPGDNGRK